VERIAFDVENREEIYEVGKVARQANGSVLLQSGQSVLLATVVIDTLTEVDDDFLPLTVQYIEKTYAAGKIPGGFIKRESKPSDFETLTSRIVDRSLRPLFPKGVKNPVQITVMVLSVDSDADLQVLALNAASAALMVSDLPISKSVSALRIAQINDEIILNPTLSQLDNSTLDLYLAGSKDELLMIEMRSLGDKEDNALSEDAFVGILEQGMAYLEKTNQSYEEKFNTYAKEPLTLNVQTDTLSDEAITFIEDNFLAAIDEALVSMAKSERAGNLSVITKDAIALAEEKQVSFTEDELGKAVEYVKRNSVRTQILLQKKRADGRGVKDVRPIEIDTNILPSVHASTLFTRGQTQALAALTLGNDKDAQMYQDLTDDGSQYENLMIHYNFPGFSVGEASRIGPAGRRELGHGNLAKRAIEPTLKLNDKQTVRIVSEILESNGSSSMATVCASSLSAQLANLNMTRLVAGVAMGLVSDGDEYVVLTDIMGLEDHDGDMDFKVAGPREGITALQMDIKLGGVSLELLKDALSQAQEARDHILTLMEKALEEAKPSQALPSEITFSLDTSTFPVIIGKGGATIREIIDTFGVNIDLDKHSGDVTILGKNSESTAGAKAKILSLVEGQEQVEYEIGSRYLGRVKKIMDFGAFVAFDGDNDGLLHISKLSKQRIRNVSDVLDVDQEVEVVIIGQRGQKIELALPDAIDD
jgi:polyribonucleotide nucleotidyltransferase